MTIDYKALAGRIKKIADGYETSSIADGLREEIADLRTVVSLLEGRAKMEQWVRDSTMLMEEAAGVIERLPAEVFDALEVRHFLYDELMGAASLLRDAHPAPQPQPERQPVSEPTEAQIEASQAALDVLAERRRQVEAEGWTPAHDDKHIGGQMAMAAACYAAHSAVDECIHCTSEDTLPALAVLLARAQSFVATCWPWSTRWWKPKDRRRNLVKAGALILAEIERLDRVALTAKKDE